MEVTYFAVGSALMTALLAFWITGLRPRFDLVAVMRWAVVVAVATAVTVAIGRVVVDLDLFGLVNVAFRQLVIGIPLAGLLVAIRSARRGGLAVTSTVGVLVLVGALLLAPLGAYMALVEPNRLVVRHEELAIAGLSVGQTVRVGVIADLQTTGPGAHEQRAISALQAEQPDLILFAGDVFQASWQRFGEQLPALRGLLGQLHAPGGVWLVPGDVDTPDRLAAATKGTEVRVLADEVATTEVRGARFAIGGLRLDYASDAAAAVAEQLEARPDADEVQILLAHRPDAVDQLPSEGTGTDLVVAGHTHGGQVVLPFFGPLMTHSHVPRAVAAGGLHHLGERAIFVGTGVGVERKQAPKMRLLDPPSVAIVTLTGRSGLNPD